MAYLAPNYMLPVYGSEYSLCGDHCLPVKIVAYTATNVLHLLPLSVV